MAAKRRRDEAVDSPPKLADPTDDDATESLAGFAKPVYLVAKRYDESPYSLLVADADAVAVGHEAPPGARNLGGIPGAKRGMSFVAAHSKHGSWIVGVGGRAGDTIIYDPIARKEFIGPELLCPKHEPILISLGGKVYAISRRPKVSLRAKRDFEPWFESLNFNKGIPCIHHLGCPSWRELPPPPFFPCLLTPEEFRNPPEVSVSSYAAVGAYVLISLEQEDKGTYGFHVVKKTWEKVCDKSLPFVGQAVPLGGSLFAACSVKPNTAAAAACVFLMSIKASTGEVSSKLTTRVLSIHEFPVASDGEIPRPIFCPLRKGSFCSIIMAAHQNQECNYMMDLQIFLTAFQMDNVEATLTAEDLKVPVQLKQHNWAYEFNVQPGYVVSHMPVVAAVSMDNGYFELFKEKTTQVREITRCNIFEAPVIRTMSRVISNLDQSTIVRRYGDNRL